jgi:hypothetical protein
MNAPTNDNESIPEPHEQGSPAEEKVKKSSAVGAIFSWYWRVMTQSCFGVLVVPALVVVFEFFTSTAGEMYFSPVTRWEQLVLIFITIALASLHFWWIRHEEAASMKMSLARGFGIVVSGYWTLLLLPLQLMGLFGYGMGVFFTIGMALLALPVFMVCIAMASAPMCLLGGFLRKGGLCYNLRQSWIGAAIGVFSLFIVEGPSYLTRLAAQEKAVDVIRRYGDPDMLVDMHYENRWGYGVQKDTSSLVLGFLQGDGVYGMRSGRSDVDLAKMYFQVTGEVINDQTLEDRQIGGGRGERGFVNDENLGGDGVMQMVPDLDLKASRYDAHIDSNSGLSYWECTYEFKNTGSESKEARMQLLLPPNGVVSRLTLWVNGEPREAAFAATAKVASAYKSVAVVQRRDPVLVRWVAPDRVLVQCFPVLAGGEMKIRLGVTSEVQDDGKVYLPRIIEKNFKVAEEVKMALWAQGDVSLQMDGLSQYADGVKWKQLSGEIAMEMLMEQNASIQVTSSGRPKLVWARDLFVKSGEEFLVREKKELSPKLYQSAVLVVDGSVGLRHWEPQIRELAQKMEEGGILARILVADEEEVKIFDSTNDLVGLRFVGGQDNLPALMRAYQIAAEERVEAVVWLHGVQPIRFDSQNALEQRVKYGVHKPALVVVDLVGGSNRVLEQLSKASRVAKQSRPDLSSGLQLEEVLRVPQDTYEWTRIDSKPVQGEEVWGQLVRWGAWCKLRYAEKVDEVVDEAAHYQLVTPHSGAVVLESQEQYDEHGLKAIDPNTAPEVPNIPEPSSVLMLLTGGLCLVMRRRRAQVV